MDNSIYPGRIFEEILKRNEFEICMSTFVIDDGVKKYGLNHLLNKIIQGDLVTHRLRNLTMERKIRGKQTKERGNWAWWIP